MRKTVTLIAPLAGMLALMACSGSSGSASAIPPWDPSTLAGEERAAFDAIAPQLSEVVNGALGNSVTGGSSVLGGVIGGVTGTPTTMSGGVTGTPTTTSGGVSGTPTTTFGGVSGTPTTTTVRTASTSTTVRTPSTPTTTVRTPSTPTTTTTTVPEITPSQQDCVATGVVKMIGAKQVLELSKAGPRTMSAAAAATTADVVLKCIDVQKLFAAEFASDGTISAKSANCLATKIDLTTVRSFLVAVFRGADGGAIALRLMDPVLAGAATCLTAEELAKQDG